MCEELLDLETLFAVKKAAPKPTDTSPELVRKLIEALSKSRTDETKRTGLDDLEYWQVSIHAIKRELPEDVTPARIGRIVRALGLSTRRISIGYLVSYNKKQLDILKEHFDMD